MIQMNLVTKQGHRLREAAYNCWGRQGSRHGCGVWDGHVHTATFKMDNQGPTVQHMELCPLLRGFRDGRGVWGRMDMWMCMTESLPVHLKLSQHCLLIGYTRIQNKKL